jgi:hypothetical protein
MLTGIHFLLTYTCSFECDHCFLYCGPNAAGTFTVAQINDVLKQSVKLRTVENIYFEGGEPFLFYPLLMKGMQLAHDYNFKIGIVTNCYWAIAEDDAVLWLEPMKKMNLTDFSVSDDAYHQDEDESKNTAKKARIAAERLGLPVGSICIEEPKIVYEDDGSNKGKPVVGGGALIKGRAVEKLIEGLPRRPFTEFTDCPHEELVKPGRVHADCYGNTHICQGISMGNIWKTPLSKLANEYKAENHPICGPLVKGGPVELAREYGVDHDEQYVDACHYCFTVRKALIDRFPEYLGPRLVYGLE